MMKDEDRKGHTTTVTRKREEKESDVPRLQKGKLHGVMMKKPRQDVLFSMLFAASVPCSLFY
jgi:hypothetical protein